MRFGVEGEGDWELRFYTKKNSGFWELVLGCREMKFLLNKAQKGTFYCIFRHDMLPFEYRFYRGMLRCNRKTVMILYCSQSVNLIEE